MDDELAEKLDLLTKFGNVSNEVYHVETFKGYRDRKDGGFTALTIELWDAGPSRHDSRWRVRVKDDDTGKEASGNPDGRLDVALANVHWDALGD